MELTIYRNGSLEKSYVRKQKALAFKKALAKHVQAVGQVIERAIGECVLYSESPALYTEMKATQRAKHIAELRTQYF